MAATGREQALNWWSFIRWLAPWPLLAPALLASVFFFLTPMMFLVYASFHGFSMISGVGGWSLENYQRLLTDPYYLEVIKTTFEIAFLSSMIALVIGYPLSMALWKAPNRMKSVLLTAIIAPLLISVIVRNFGWVVILDRYGLLNSLLKSIHISNAFVDESHLFTIPAVSAGLVHAYLPVMVLSIYSALQKQQTRLVDAARNLGANPFWAFLFVTLPLSLPGIIAGVTTVFALAAGSYITVAMLGGSRIMVMSVLVYQQTLGLSNWQFGSAIAIVLLISTIIVLQLIQYIAKLAFRSGVPA